MKEVTVGNKLKAAQLGMPIGTAMNRLRKQLLFSYLVKCADNAVDNGKYACIKINFIFNG